MPLTVINGPPERSLTRSPLRNTEAARFCAAVVDGAEAEKAGAKGMPSRSVAANAIDAGFVDPNILNSIALVSLLITVILVLAF
jgi:hypothetical protein